MLGGRFAAHMTIFNVIVNPGDKEYIKMYID